MKTFFNPFNACIKLKAVKWFGLQVKLLVSIGLEHFLKWVTRKMTSHLAFFLFKGNSENIKTVAQCMKLFKVNNNCNKFTILLPELFSTILPSESLYWFAKVTTIIYFITRNLSDAVNNGYFDFGGNFGHLSIQWKINLLHK